jgi:hypothetical protein
VPENEELDTLRTKLLLCNAEINTIGIRYAVVIAGTTHFRFPPPNNTFYATELEALQEGIRLVLAGTPYWTNALENAGKPPEKRSTNGN